MTVDWLTLTHAFATVAMTGVIWFVQVVHYPLFEAVGRAEFQAFEARHVRRTTWIVGPLMLGEAATAIGLAFDAERLGIATWLGLALLATAWLSTLLLQVPCHRRLENGFDDAVARRLVNTNWIRTIAWTARAVLALLLLGGDTTPP